MPRSKNEMNKKSGSSIQQSSHPTEEEKSHMSDSDEEMQFQTRQKLKEKKSQPLDLSKQPLKIC